MKTADRDHVRRRAADRCEYCGLHQRHDPILRFHIEHVVPPLHGGDDSLSNLCLACPWCNLHKSSHLA
jgi:5-methylcytosine-specific restriction endonuclease McrA